MTPRWWIASEIFGVELEPSAAAAAIDGRFSSGRLAGRTVNVKWYLKREGLIDLVDSTVLDYYLVLTGPASAVASSRGGTRPWCVASVYLFDAKRLVDELRARGARVGVASSVRAAQWDAAEVYPRSNNDALVVEPEQVGLLRLVAPSDRRQDYCRTKLP